LFFGCGVFHSSRCAKVTIQVNNSTARALPQKRKRTISTEKNYFNRKELFQQKRKTKKEKLAHGRNNIRNIKAAIFEKVRFFK
jgi:hypothetical protein